MVVSQYRINITSTIRDDDLKQYLSNKFSVKHMLDDAAAAVGSNQYMVRLVQSEKAGMGEKLLHKFLISWGSKLSLFSPAILRRLSICV